MKMIKATFKSVLWCPYCVDDADMSGDDNFYHGGFYGHGICERCGKEDDLAECVWKVEQEETEADKQLRLIDLHIEFRRGGLPTHVLPIYDKVADALRKQFVAEEISADIVLDTVDNMSCDLEHCPDSAWMAQLLKMMEVKA